jgi:hypothetical protein
MLAALHDCQLQRPDAFVRGDRNVAIGLWLLLRERMERTALRDLPCARIRRFSELWKLLSGLRRISAMLASLRFVGLQQSRRRGDGHPPNWMQLQLQESLARIRLLRLPHQRQLDRRLRIVHRRISRISQLRSDVHVGRRLLEQRLQRHRRRHGRLQLPVPQPVEGRHVQPVRRPVQLLRRLRQLRRRICWNVSDLPRTMLH